MTPNYFITQMKTLETEKKITINGVKITLKKLPLRKIIGLLSDLQTLPEQVTNLDKMPSDKILETLPLLLASRAVELPVFQQTGVRLTIRWTCSRDCDFRRSDTAAIGQHSTI